MAKTKGKDAQVCAWQGCAAPATRLLTWGEGIQQEFCNYHADAALDWADIREHDWRLRGDGDENSA